MIIGAARQGLALARYFLKHGASVIVNDRQTPEKFSGLRDEFKAQAGTSEQIKWVLGGHPLGILDDADIVFVSGGVPLENPLVQEAQTRGITVTNDSELFLENAPCKVIGITGSAGKTTTTTLVGRMAQSAASRDEEKGPYRKVWVGGNIGTPLISCIDEMVAEDLAIMELSSFQLELMSSSPQIAALLNITPNHLDRHKSMEAYTSTKKRILDFQSPEDWAILGRDDPGAWSLAADAKGSLLSFGLNLPAALHAGTYYENGSIFLRNSEYKSEPVKILDRSEISLRGDHNLLNVMAACSISSAALLDVVAMRAGIIGFSGVPHRLEFIRKWGGADWYNDSIATAPERSMAAIRAFDEPLVLIAGGRDKDLPWNEFASLVVHRVDHVILFGEAAGVIWTAMEKKGAVSLAVTRCKGLKEAVQAAAGIVQAGDVVLLSPGGTSFDEFRDFEERGEHFIQWVKELV
ncbi:MAG: UDP-N-acetylmuramoylalanine--D-glutamate ligase [Chloroflexi bacterium RBG_16_54_18]|nr:MAG: UDP-N-acetylmuramoylalanine--D-glutamate ligase [Chloroflexi bacterium RBG_16_54_18]